MVKMKQFTNRKVSLLLACTLVFASCDSDDDMDPEFQGETKEYALQPVANSSVEGTVTFIENENSTTTVEIELDGTEDGESYSPRLLYGNAVDGGELAVAFEEIEGDPGTISISISKLDDNTVVSYEDLVELDGHIVIYLVETDTETSVAVADIGENELTGESVSYGLSAVGDAGITSTVKLEERLNGSTLITLSSEETEEGDVHPAFILSGAVGDNQGAKVVSLNPIDEGSSFTNVSAFDKVEDEESENMSYEDLMEYDGSLNIYLSEGHMETIVSQGDIGSNS